MSIKPLIYNRRNADEARDLLVSLQPPNRLPITAIENAVTSVNGMTGDVVIDGQGGDFQPRSDILTDISEMSLSTSGMVWQDGGDFTVSPVSSFVRSTFSSPNENFFRGMLGLGDSSVLDTDVPFGIPTLDEDGKIPEIIFPFVLSEIATSGSYNDLVDKPTLFSGDYNDLTNKPVIPVVEYPVSSVNGKTGDVVLSNVDVGAAATSHTHTMSEITGLQASLDAKITSGSSIPYSSLTGAPALSSVAISGSYTDLVNKPTLFSGDYNDLVNKPVLFDGNWASLSGKPVLFDGAWGSLTGRPTFSAVATSGSYNDLSNRPTIPAPQVNADWNSVGGVSQILNKPALFDGNYNSLTNKPTIPSAQVNADWNAVSGVSQILNKPTLFNGTWASLTGKPTFSTVATSGSYADLSNKPTIPTSTTQVAEGTNLYYTDARVASYIASNGYRKVETLQGTTNASGVYQVVFGNTYSVAPHVNPVIINGTAAMMLTVSNVTTTGCTITVVQRSAVTLLAVEVLLAATTPVSGATVGVLVVAK